MSDTVDDAAARSAQKKVALETALERGKVQVRLAPQRAGVRLPEQFTDESMLSLNLSWRFPHTEMVINERGVAATLRFNSEPHRCAIPWSALFALIPTDGEPLVWPPDVPTEFGGPPREESDADEDVEPVEDVEPTRPRFSVVSGGLKSAPPAPSQPETDAPSLIEASESKALESEPEADNADEPTEPEPPTPVSERAPWLKLVR